MDPITAMAAAGGGAASLIGGYMTNQANAQNAQSMMDFQRDMSGTAYERQVNDMRAAGLNPMFATGSGGASTPSGAMSVSTNPISPAVSTAGQIATIGQAQTQLGADVGLKTAQSAQALAAAQSSKAQIALAQSQAAKTDEDTRLAKMSEPEKKAWNSLYSTFNSATQAGRGALQNIKDTYDALYGNQRDTSHFRNPRPFGSSLNWSNP